MTATLVLSLIAAGTIPIATDNIVAVQNGAVDARITFAQAASFFWGSPTFTGTVTMPDSRTWSSSGIHEASALNITSSGSDGLALQVNTASVFSTGLVLNNTSAGGRNWSFFSTGSTNIVPVGTFGTFDSTSGVLPLCIATSASGPPAVLGFPKGSILAWSSDPLYGGSANSGGQGIYNACIYSGIANTFTLGNVDSGSLPSYQALTIQSVAAGNGNVAGQTFFIVGSLSNGSGAGGDIGLYTTASSAGSGVQNASAEVVTLRGGTQVADFAGKVKMRQGGTGATTVTLGTNSPATLAATAPYTWFTMLAPDGTTVWVPGWK